MIEQKSRASMMLGQPVDLLAIDTSQPRPWTPGAKRMMRPGLRSIWFGSRGSGKSLAALIAAVQVIEAGGSVVYLDWENGPRRQAERLAAILADRLETTRAAIAERFDYRPNVRIDTLGDAAAVEEWGTLFSGHDLAVIDSAARALGQLGLDENLAADFTRFTATYIDPIAERGVAVLLLDNTGHEEQQRTRGSSAKLDLFELAYHATSKDIAPDRAGTITLHRVRTRDGDEAGELVAHVGAGDYSEVHQPDGDEHQGVLSETLIEHLREQPGESTEAVAKSLHLRPSRVRDGLAILEAAGTAVRCPSQVTNRRGRPYTRQGWHLAQESQLASVPESRTDTGGCYTAASDRPTSPPLKGGRGLAEPDIDRAEALAARARETGMG